MWIKEFDRKMKFKQRTKNLFYFFLNKIGPRLKKIK